MARGSPDGGCDSTENSATYLSVSGTVEIVRDRKVIHDLWEADWKPWFPKGPDEGDIALLRFVPEHAEYVHPAGGKLNGIWMTQTERGRGATLLDGGAPLGAALGAILISALIAQRRWRSAGSNRARLCP